jgi:transcriptional regulator with XRE-family HTH domain
VLDNLYPIEYKRMTTDKRFVMRLKKLRANQGMTQEALAEKAGISRTYLARLELGQQDPTLGTLRKLAKALKVTVGELVE